jgi:hypothetical protein
MPIKLRTGLRLLLRKSGMAGAVIMLALGIGASAAIFSVYTNAKQPRHYVFFGMGREIIKDASSFLETKALEGAQVAYWWRQLEPEKDKYDFSLIRRSISRPRAGWASATCNSSCRTMNRRSASSYFS